MTGTPLIRLLDEDSVRRRHEAIVARLYQAVRQAMGLNLALGIAGVALGLVLAVLGRHALAVGVSITTVVLAAIVWVQIVARAGWGGLELATDHDRYERHEWEKAARARMPRTLAATRAWLRAHPDGPSTTAMLLRVGRLDEADAATAALPTRTREEALSRDILRAISDLLRGSRPETTSLHITWGELPSSTERLHLRECLALLDAQIAAAADEPAWPVLVAARAEIDLISVSSWRSRQAVGWLVTNVMLVVLPVTVASTLRFS